MASRLQDRGATREIAQQLRKLEEYIHNDTNIEPTLNHLVKMRASQINNCAHCLMLHAEEALKYGERVDRLTILSAWRESADWFTPREQAALIWTEAVTNISDGPVDDETYATVREQFSEKDLADLTLSIVAINGWNRINVPFRTPAHHFDVPEPDVVTR